MKYNITALDSTQESLDFLVKNVGGEAKDWKRIRKVKQFDDSARVFENKQLNKKVTVWFVVGMGYHLKEGDFFPKKTELEDKVVATMNKISHQDDYFIVYLNPLTEEVWLNLGDGGLPTREEIQLYPEDYPKGITSWEDMMEIFEKSNLNVKVEAETDPSWSTALRFLNSVQEYHYKESMTYFGYYQLFKAKGKQLN